MKTLELLKLLLGLLPAIMEAVKAAEALLPEGGKGAAKLAMIRETLQAGWTHGNDTLGAFEAAWPAISAVVGAVVNLANSTGIFKKATPAS